MIESVLAEFRQFIPFGFIHENARPEFENQAIDLSEDFGAPAVAFLNSGADFTREPAGHWTAARGHPCHPAFK